jgi:hypothetical protein
VAEEQGLRRLLERIHDRLLACARSMMMPSGNCLVRLHVRERRWKLWKTAESNPCGMFKLACRDSRFRPSR